MATQWAALLVFALGAAAAAPPNCTTAPLPYRIDVCDLFHPPPNASVVRRGAVAATGPGLHRAGALGRLAPLLDARLRAAGASVEVVGGGDAAAIVVDDAAFAARVTAPGRADRVLGLGRDADARRGRAPCRSDPTSPNT